jgi:hypothetical protein
VPEQTGGTVKIKIIAQMNPVVKSIAFTGLTAAEDAAVRPSIIVEMGKRTSKYDLFMAAKWIRFNIGKKNPAERKFSIDVTGEDGTTLHQDMVVPISGT